MIIPPPIPSNPERNPDMRLARPMILKSATIALLFVIELLNNFLAINRQNLYWQEIYVLSIFTNTSNSDYTGQIS
jgi:hypothetical protein